MARVKIVCDICGTVFERPPSRLGRARFCSTHCRGVAAGTAAAAAAARRRGQASPPLFWDRAMPRGDCWEWRFGRDKNGYGAYRVGKSNQRAHRVAWELTNGPIPPGMFVCHRCDNPPCIRPEHLFLGTNAENTADKIAKGRQRYIGPYNPARGEQQACAKLTPTDVRVMRDAYATGVNRADLSRQFGISWTTADLVVRRQIWRHVP